MSLFGDFLVWSCLGARWCCRCSRLKVLGWLLGNGTQNRWQNISPTFFLKILKNDIFSQKVTFFLITVIAALLILLLLGGKYFTALAFNGKYDFALQFNIIVPLCFLGILQCAHTIIHFYIYAKSSNKVLINYTFYLFIYCIGYYLSFILLARVIEYSIASIIQHILILWCLKVIMSIIMSFYISQKKPKLELA